MIEPEAVIDPEVVPAAPSRRRRRAVLAGVTALALVAGAVAVTSGGGQAEPEPLSLMAGNGAGGGTEKLAAPTVAGSPPAATADGRSFAPFPSGGWGVTFEVEGNLPGLPDRAHAWRLAGPGFDRATVVRIAGALGLTGEPVQRDGGWFVDSGDLALNAFPGGDIWSLNVFRNRYDGRTDDAPVGPALSRADAEQRVRDLLDRIGAPSATWKFETTESEIGVGWACAAPAPPISPEELKKLEAEKLGQLEQSPTAAPAAPHPELIGPTPADMPAPDRAVATCPPPPPPVKGFNVAVHPVLEGRTADMAAWNVTLRSDGHLEGLYGQWATFEQGGDYKLRGVDAAWKDLQSPAQPLAAFGNDTPAVAATEPALGRPEIAPVPPVPPTPQVVKVTGVELGLLQTSVFEDGRVRLMLVPAYRFAGHFADSGMVWETSVLALHPDAIAPPPNVPVSDDLRSGGGVTGIGKAVPPTPEPAIVSEPGTSR